jgi:hypothetical protein
MIVFEIYAGNKFSLVVASATGIQFFQDVDLLYLQVCKAAESGTCLTPSLGTHVATIFTPNILLLGTT